MRIFFKTQQRLIEKKKMDFFSKKYFFQVSILFLIISFTISVYPYDCQNGCTEGGDGGQCVHYVI